jgi:hypothetical protein
MPSITCCRHPSLRGPATVLPVLQLTAVVTAPVLMPPGDPPVHRRTRALLASSSATRVCAGHQSHRATCSRAARGPCHPPIQPQHEPCARHNSNAGASGPLLCQRWCTGMGGSGCPAPRRTSTRAGGPARASPLRVQHQRACFVGATRHPTSCQRRRRRSAALRLPPVRPPAPLPAPPAWPTPLLATLHLELQWKVREVRRRRSSCCYRRGSRASCPWRQPRGSERVRRHFRSPPITTLAPAARRHVESLAQHQQRVAAATERRPRCPHARVTVRRAHRPPQRGGADTLVTWCQAACPRRARSVHPRFPQRQDATIVPPVQA